MRTIVAVQHIAVRGERTSRFWPVLLVLLLLMAGCSKGTEFSGTTLEPPRAAPGFALTNQFGEPMSLQDLRGKVVVLTFLYSSCPDFCPLITNKMAQVRDEFGERSSDLAFVAISVDPERDTVPSVLRYLQERGLERKLIYLTGDTESLQPVWRAYAIGVTREKPTGTNKAIYEVGHSDALYLIDKSGRERVLMSSDFATADLARNLNALLRESENS